MPCTCTGCGVVAGDGDGDFPPGWSFATTRRGIEWLCAGCTRANVRSIEAKLSEEWWE